MQLTILGYLNVQNIPTSSRRLSGERGGGNFTDPKGPGTPGYRTDGLVNNRQHKKLVDIASSYKTCNNFAVSWRRLGLHSTVLNPKGAL